MVKLTRDRLRKLRCPSCGSRAKDVLPCVAGQREVMKITTCCNCGYVSIYAKNPQIVMSCILNSQIQSLPNTMEVCKRRNECEFKDSCPREN